MGPYFPPIPSSDNLEEDPEVWDVIVVGAGVAGSALAYKMAKDGRRVLVLERDLSEPDRIVGELLQPGGYQQLIRLGLQHCTDDIDAVEVVGYAMFLEDKQIKIQYPGPSHLPPPTGRSFHHGRFVQQLRRSCHGESSATMRQATVQRLVNDQGNEWEDGQIIGGVQYKLSKTSQIHKARAHLTLVCDGMYSSLREKLTGPAQIKHPGYFVGIQMNIDQNVLPFPNHGHVVIADPSVMLFYPTSSTTVRCLIDVPGDRLPTQSTGELRKYIEEIVLPKVPSSIKPHLVQALDTATIRSMRNKQMAAKPIHRPGAVMLGDAFNMRHPVTGGGMTVALSDCNLLASLLSSLPSFSDCQTTTKATSSFHVARKPMSATINTVANAVYEVIRASKYQAHNDMRSAFVDYIYNSRQQHDGPVGLLGGLTPSPVKLVQHFYLVALLGVWQVMQKVKNPIFMATRVIHLLIIGTSIILPLLFAEGPLAVFAPGWKGYNAKQTTTAEYTQKAQKVE